MPKITTFDKWSETLKKHLRGDIHYHLQKNRGTGSTGFFYIIIPEEMKDLYDRDKNAENFYNRGTSKFIIKGGSADEAVKNFIDYTEMFYQAKSQVTKVIMYRFNFSSKNKSSDPPKKGYTSMDGISNTLEAKLEFDYAVCDKTDFGGKISFKAHDAGKNNKWYDRGRDGFDSKNKKAGASYGGWVELPYTVEAETFFAQVYSGMESIMEKLMKYIGTEEGAMKMIENQQKLLA